MEANSGKWSRTPTSDFFLYPFSFFFSSCFLIFFVFDLFVWIIALLLTSCEDYLRLLIWRIGGGSYNNGGDGERLF